MKSLVEEDVVARYALFKNLAIVPKGIVYQLGMHPASRYHKVGYTRVDFCLAHIAVTEFVLCIAFDFL